MKQDQLDYPFVIKIVQNADGRRMKVHEAYVRQRQTVHDHRSHSLSDDSGGVIFL